MSGRRAGRAAAWVPPVTHTRPSPAACSIKFGLPRDGDLQQLAQQIVSACRLLHAQRVPEVERLLVQAREQQQRQGEQQQEPAEAAALEAPQRYSDLDRQLLRQQQQQQYLADAAASATQALSAAAATASLVRLDEYLVGTFGGLENCSSSLT